MEQPNGIQAIKRRSELHKKRVMELRKKGYSIRQIMREMGFKSPRSVTYFLEKVEKQN